MDDQYYVMVNELVNPFPHFLEDILHMLHIYSVPGLRDATEVTILMSWSINQFLQWGDYIYTSGPLEAHEVLSSHQLDNKGCAAVIRVSARSMKNLGLFWASVHLCIHEVSGATSPSPSKVGHPCHSTPDSRAPLHVHAVTSSTIIMYTCMLLYYSHWVCTWAQSA